jgi:hypothetical protein
MRERQPAVVIPFKRTRCLSDRRAERRRQFRRKGDTQLLIFISVGYAAIYAIGFLMGALSRG